MGGNALKNCTTRRYDAVEYHALENEVRRLWHNNFHTNAWPIIAYSKKESFGDMDLLVVAETLPPRWVESVTALFNTKEYHKNGNVLSFEYKEFQIDLIVTPQAELVSSAQYFAYNDLGNLIGRVAHSLGLKLGHDGLTYKFYGKERHLFKEIKLLDDWEDILPVLGYSWERYKKGFDTLEDIFEFVVSSPFFNKAIYALEKRNHAARTRDRKRKTYMSFLDWLEGYEENEEQIFYAGSEPDATYLFKEIPGFKEAYESTASELALAEKFKERYNGEIVSTITTLEGKALGEFMKWMKDTHNYDRMRKDVCSMNEEIIPVWIAYWFGKYKLEG